MRALQKCCYCLPLGVGLYVLFVMEIAWQIYSIVFIVDFYDWKVQKITKIIELVIAVKMLIIDVLVVVAVYRQMKCFVFLLFIVLFVKFFAINTYRICMLVQDFTWPALVGFFIKISVDAYSTVILYSYYVKLNNELPDDPPPPDIHAELDDEEEY